MTTRMIRFHCPGCGKRMKAPARAAGRVGRCLKCATRILIPSDDRGPEAASGPGHGGGPARSSVRTSPVAGSLRVPVPHVGAPLASPAPPAVPLRVTLPRGAGTVEAQVSQPASDALSGTLLGGLLVGGTIVGGVALLLACPPLAGALAAAATAAASGRRT